MKLSSLKTDTATIEQGRWVKDIPDMGGLELKVRGLGNTDYRRLMDKKVEAVPRAKKVRGLDTAERDRVVSECLHEAILIDWKGLTDDNDEPLPYTKEHAFQLLTDPDFARFRGAVIWAAGVVSEEADLGAKDAEGN